MPSLTPILLLTFLTACKGGANQDSGLLDADGDGFAAFEDCDDDNVMVFPGAEELCDGLDNDCDTQTDNAATDATIWYADADADGHGDAAGEVRACQAPQGYVADATDCNDGETDISPSASEVCNGRDDDCDGLVDEEDDSVDLSSGVTWWADADGDGYGAGEPTQSCTVPPGMSGSGNDCDDEDWTTYPGAPEICDGLDNSCDESIDEGVMGSDYACPVQSCLSLVALGESTNGSYWIDPSGADPFLAMCDLTSDGGGWTLVTWTNSTSILSSGLWQSEPYPGLDICRKLDCNYGSAGRLSRMESLIQISSAFGSGMSTTSLDTFQPLADYEYASAFVYGDLSAVTLSVDTPGECESEGSIEGVNTVLSGPRTYEGKAVWLSPELRVGEESHSSKTNYLWSYGLSAPCQEDGSMPAVYIGTWSPNNFGPYLQGAGGSRSTWVR
jgi:hypothetical protein